MTGMMKRKCLHNKLHIDYKDCIIFLQNPLNTYCYLIKKKPCSLRFEQDYYVTKKLKISSLVVPIRIIVR